MLKYLQEGRGVPSRREQRRGAVCGGQARPASQALFVLEITLDKASGASPETRSGDEWKQAIPAKRRAKCIKKVFLRTSDDPRD